MRDIRDYLHLYLGSDAMTPDGIGKMVGFPYYIMSRESVYIHFGHMVKTKNSNDGYDKTRNHGRYSIIAQRYEPVGTSGITEDGFDAPGGVKPVLRPLSDMTDEEMEEIWHLLEPKNVFEMNYKNSSITRKVALCSERTIYLLSKGFDLFNLIPENLAIDKTKL